MTYTQVWDTLCSYVFTLFPNCVVKKQYRPIENIEKLAEYTRPIVWVGLSNVNIGSVTSNATVVEDVYNFQLLLAWKLRDSEDQSELDDKLNNVQQFLTLFRHKYVSIGNSRLYFGLPSCESPYDEDLLTSPGIFLATCTIPVTTYRDLNECTDEASSEEATAGDQVN